MTTFRFSVPSQAEVEARLAALYEARHANHRPGEPARYCPHCPPRQVARLVHAGECA